MLFNDEYLFFNEKHDNIQYYGMLENKDLTYLCEKNKLQYEIIYKNELSNMRKKKNMTVIINLKNPYADGSNHWVLLIRRDYDFFYFDSLGKETPNEIKRYCKKSQLIISDYVTDDIKFCGWLCISLIDYIKSNDETFYTKCSDFINLIDMYDDYHLKNYFYNNIIR